MHASSGATGELVGVGLGASPGRAVGVVVRSVDEALAAYDRGDAVVFVSVETAPVDEPAMHVAVGSGDRRVGDWPATPRCWRATSGSPPCAGSRRWPRWSTAGRSSSTVRNGEVARRPWWPRRRCAGRRTCRHPTSCPRPWPRCWAGRTSIAAGRLEVRANVDLAPSASSCPPLRREGRGVVPHRARLPREPGGDPPPGGTWRRRCPRRGRPVAARRARRPARGDGRPARRRADARRARARVRRGDRAQPDARPSWGARRDRRRTAGPGPAPGHRRRGGDPTRRRWRAARRGAGAAGVVAGRARARGWVGS